MEKIFSISLILLPWKRYYFCLKMLSFLQKQLGGPDSIKYIFWNLNTTWKVSKYGVFSGPYFPVFGLNTEIYSVNFRIQSKYRKIRTKKNSIFGHFSRSGNYGKEDLWKVTALLCLFGKYVHYMWYLHWHYLTLRRFLRLIWCYKERAFVKRNKHSEFESKQARSASRTLPNIYNGHFCRNR